MLLLELIPLNVTFEIINEKWKESIRNWGIFGAFALGLLFASSFCPTSAALFSGGVFPLAIHKNSPLVIPFFYGIITGLPVIIFAFLISSETTKVNTVYNIISNVELWARKITGVIFILGGIYLTLIYIFQLHVLLRK